MILEGFIPVAKYRDVDFYLSGSKWVDSIQKVKLGDIKAFPQKLNMTEWPVMDQSYRNAKITISIEL